MIRNILILLASSALLAAAPAPFRSTAEEIDYTKKITERADNIVAEVKADAKHNAEFKATLTEQYRALDAWQRTHEDKLKTLKKEAAGQEKDVASKASATIRDIMAERKKLHDAFIARLTSFLSAEQLELVKDLMTYKKVAVTFNAYCSMYPSLNDEQKAKILGMLKEAREEAMDGGSADEKSAIFGKYKGRINNFLSKEGLTKPKAP